MVENLPLWYHQFLTLTSTCCVPSDPGVDAFEVLFAPIWFVLLLWDRQLISIKYFPQELQLLPPSLSWRLFTISKMTLFEFLIFSSCSWCKISGHVGRHQEWNNIKSMSNMQDLLLHLVSLKYLLFVNGSKEYRGPLGLVHLYRYNARYIVAHQ